VRRCRMKQGWAAAFSVLAREMAGAGQEVQAAGPGPMRVQARGRDLITSGYADAVRPSLEASVGTSRMV